MYKKPIYVKSKIPSSVKVEGESIEEKITRILDNGEAIEDSAPEIYTERKQGVGAEFNIRTDRWELAAESMDLIAKQKEAKRQERALSKEEKKEAKVVKLDSKKGVEGDLESTNGTSDSK